MIKTFLPGIWYLNGCGDIFTVPFEQDVSQSPFHYEERYSPTKKQRGNLTATNRQWWESARLATLSQIRKHIPDYIPQNLYEIY